ncbi:hypothetical protein VTO42DRAFT_836 [Malbranchea cinnamomea]
MAKRSLDELSLGFPELQSDNSRTIPMLPTPEPESPQTPQRKFAHLEDQSSTALEVMKCTLPPHRTSYSFSNYEDYEVHYKQYHVNRCSECGKNFPSERFLTLHIEENHDSLMEARRAKGEKTYGCFVEGCEKRCSTPQKRRLHLIDKHMFPMKYNFFIVNDGIDRQTSMLRSSPTSTQARRISLSAPTLTVTSIAQGSRRQNLSQSLNEGSQASPAASQHASTASITSRGVGSDLPQSESSSAQGTVQHTTDEMADLTKSMSALRFVPKSVSLRHQKMRRNDVSMNDT